MKIVVIGGNGLIGKKLVNNLRERDHQVVAASRSTGVDTLTGKGLPEVTHERFHGCLPTSPTPPPSKTSQSWPSSKHPATTSLLPKPPPA